ncbi:hypothetical protein [Streptomyces sp. NPDC102476]|uniref:hypothetical protein n=1 Tax=Streptomyces sp. NPDC102476 TaxID=3366181 RepID=UPI00381AB8EB
MRTAMRQMMGFFAQLDRGMTVAKLRRGRRIKGEKGQYAYGAPRRTDGRPTRRSWPRKRLSRRFLEQLGSCLTSIGLRKAVSKIKDPDERKKWANIIKTGKFDLGLSQTEAGDIWEGVRVAIVTFVPGTGCVLFKPTPAGG